MGSLVHLLRHLSFAVPAFTTLALAASTAHADFALQTGSPHAVGADPLNLYIGEITGGPPADLVTVNGTASTISLLSQEPAGVINDAFSSGLGSGGTPNLGALADFNADGFQDFAVSNFNGGSGNQFSVSIKQGEAESPLYGVSDYLSLGPASRASGVAAGDLTGDGKMDAAVSMYDAGKIAIFARNAANNGFAQIAGSPFAVTGVHPTDIAVGDLDGANGPDLAIVMADSAQITTLLSQPGGGYAQPAGMPISVGTTPSHLVIAPLNGDALPDIAVTSFGSDSVTVLNRVPAGGFTPAVGSPYLVGDAPVGLVATDLNGQGGRDLAVANSGSNTIDVLRNNGSGGFTRLPSTPTAPATGPYGLVSGEFSGDTKPDLAFSAIGTDDVGILVNTSGGPPANQVKPVVTGTRKVGQELTCGDGQWSESPTSFAKSWQRADGASFSTVSDGGAYTVQKSDAGKQLRCRVVATNAEGTGEAPSEAVTIFENLPPVVTMLPTTDVSIHGATIHYDVDDKGSPAVATPISFGVAGTGLPGIAGATSTREGSVSRYTAELTGLRRGVPYEVQVHATNEAGRTDGPVRQGHHGRGRGR